MRNRLLVGLMLRMSAALAVFVMGSGPVAGQERGGGRAARPADPVLNVPRTPDGKPDLRGVWYPGGDPAPTLTHTNIIEAHAGGFGLSAGKSLIVDPSTGIIPYQPWALAERDRRRRPESAYEDPVGHCEFYSIARLHNFPLTIVYSGNNIVLFANQHMTRSIPMDRREHLPGGIRLWMGDPIGRWDGDALVIDTTNFNGKTWLALGGDFHGADAHIAERFTMSDANTLNWQAAISDPKVYTRPWTMTAAVPFLRARDEEEWEEDSCHEGNVDLVHLKNVRDQSLKTGATDAQ